jgi:stress-induced morphogen
MSEEARCWVAVLEDRLRDEYPGSAVRVSAESDNMKRFRIDVVSDAFAALAPEARQRAVLDAIGFKPTSRDDEDRRTVSALTTSELIVVAHTSAERAASTTQ